MRKSFRWWLNHCKSPPIQHKKHGDVLIRNTLIDNNVNDKHKNNEKDIEIDNNEQKIAQLLDFGININEKIFSSNICSHIKNYKISKYPDSDALALKNSLVKLYSKSNAVENISSENFLITAGAMEALHLIGETFIDKKMKNVIIEPTFTEYEWIIRKFDGICYHYYRNPNNNFKLDTENLYDFLNFLHPTTRMLWICSPNNPNGLMDSRELIENLLNICTKKDILVILDASFIDFTEAEFWIFKIAEIYKNLIVVRSFTKFYGIPGLRIGYIFACREIIKLLKANQILWPVNNVAIKHMLEIISDPNIIKNISDVQTFYNNERKWVIDQLNEIDYIKVFPSDTNFILIELKNIENYDEKLKNNKKNLKNKVGLSEILKKKGIVIRPCADFNGLDNNFYRIAIKDRKENTCLIEELKSIKFNPTFKKAI